jgi:hypothetical protein
LARIRKTKDNGEKKKNIIEENLTTKKTEENGRRVERPTFNIQRRIEEKKTEE